MRHWWGVETNVLFQSWVIWPPHTEIQVLMTTFFSQETDMVLRRFVLIVTFILCWVYFNLDPLTKDCRNNNQVDQA